LDPSYGLNFTDSRRVPLALLLLPLLSQRRKGRLDFVILVVALYSSRRRCPFLVISAFELFHGFLQIGRPKDPLKSFEGQDGVGSKQFFLYAKFLSSLLLLPYSFLREIERAREKRDKTRPERRGGRRTKLTSSVSSRARRRKRVFFSFALKAMWVFSNLSLWGVGRSGKRIFGSKLFYFSCCVPSLKKGVCVAISCSLTLSLSLSVSLSPSLKNLSLSCLFYMITSLSLSLSLSVTFMRYYIKLQHWFCFLACL